MIKNIIRVAVLLFAIIPAKAQNIVNGSFTQFGDPNCVPNSGNCSTFTGDCVTNWKRSHGTPQIFQSGSNYYVWMWSQTDCCSKWGEGVFAGYTFEKNRQYKVLLNIESSGNSNMGTNRLKLFAANGIGEYTGSCNGGGTGLPNITSKQAIGETTISGQWGTPWDDRNFTFTADENYTQLWIYPWAEYQVGGSGQFNISIDDIQIIPDVCTPTIVYNTGTVPSGSLEYGNIYAGSSAGTGGSGTVNVASNANTSMIAANEIVFSPEFHAQVASGYTFSASIRPCEGTGTITANEEVLSGTATDDIAAIKDNNRLSRQVQVYPNPVKNWIMADIYLGDEDRASIRLLNSMGVVVRQQIPARKLSGRQRIDVDVSSLPTGIYFLQVISKKGVITQKVEKL